MTTTARHMKTPNLIVILCLLFAPALAADNTPAEAPQLSPSEVETLVGPIALYPDALIAIILPASANSTDIVLAARYLEKGGAIDQADSQPWDESVRSLAHYPEVLKWMDENLEWTQQLGVTFLAQPGEMMAAVQRLRARALALGNLPSTGQLTVVKEADYIRIVPAVPETIYVPYYDPDVIFVSRFYWGFGPAWICGPWLSYDCNWISRSIWIGTWQPHYFYRPPWARVVRRPPSPHYIDRHTWRPDPRRIATHPRPPHPRPGHIVRPRPIANMDFNKPGHPPPAHRPSHPSGNLTGRRPPASPPGTPPAQLNRGDTQTHPPSTVRPSRRPPRNPDAKSRPHPANSAPAHTHRPAPTTPAPSTAQQATESRHATPPPAPPSQPASTRDSSESRNSISSDNSSTTSSSRSTNSSESRSSYHQERSSYQEGSSRPPPSSHSQRSTPPSAPRESRPSRPGAR